MLKQIDAKEQHEMLDGYKHRREKDLYQVKCRKGFERDLVLEILNKARYVARHPDHFTCSLVSALAVPKKFPGFIFVEGRNPEEIRKSLDNFTGLTLSSIKKIEFEMYSQLFEEAYTPINDFKREQYVRVKVGAYREDIGQIVKVNKRGAVVQLVPRISFGLINLRMGEIDGLSRNFTEPEIMKIKNEILKRLTNPRVTYRADERPPKKKLSQSDFFVYNEFPHNKNIKITEDGLILASYSFREIECPKTTISPQDILALNPPTDDPAAFLRHEAKHIRMEFEVRPNELVQVVGGELKGIVGRVYESSNKIVRIMCLNSDIKGMVVDELQENLQKKFREGERVVVMEGAYKGEEGMVYRNGSDTLSILTDANQKIDCLKRNVQTQLEARLSFANDLGVRPGHLISVRGTYGVVSAVKKVCVDYVSTRNHLLRATNGEFDLIPHSNNFATTRDAKRVGRGCLVQVARGGKKDKVMRVRHVYRGFLFLHDPEAVELGGNWVEKADDCNLYVLDAPFVEAQYLNPTRDHSRLRHPSRLSKHSTAEENEEYKVGKPFRVLEGVYKGVKGVIVASFKDQIEVRVLQDKIVEVSRKLLDRKEDHSERRSREDHHFDRRSRADSVSSNFVRKVSSQHISRRDS
jgi:transcription elongation factor SPT5